MNKGIILGIVILVIGMSFTGTTNSFSMSKSQMNSFDGNILFVGGSGEGNYTSIKSAIDNASDGDTVFVYDNSSPYYENIEVNKMINLVGEDKNSTVIDGGGHDDVIYVRRSKVKISGFTIQNSGQLGWQNGWDGGVDIRSRNVIINNNIIFNNFYGIVSIDGRNHTFSYNTISENNKYGLVLWDDGYNNIVGNRFLENCDGFFMSGAGYNKVLNNVFVSSEHSGIIVTHSKNTVSDNTFFNDGICIYDSNNNISNNIVNGKPLIYLENEINMSIEEPAGQIILVHCHNIIIQDQHINKTSNGIQLWYSNNCQISNSTLLKNKYGFLLGHSRDNVISCNKIIQNDHGIRLDNSPRCTFYHNTLLNNTHNAYGSCRWDDGYPSGGNYWDDYTGKDNDGDGIGDTPYNIDGGSKDKYPLMEPYGNVRANNNGPVYDFINNPIQFNGFACGGNPPYTWFWDFGDGNTSVAQNPINTYTKVGKYTIYLSVADNDDNTSDHTSWARIQITNNPPNKPKINGPTHGKVGNYYNYTFVSEDLDETEVRYYIDWGDGQIEESIGWHASGEEVTISHKWSWKGTYIIWAKARDGYNAESDWSKLEVTIGKNKAINNVLFWSFLERFPLLHRLLDIWRSFIE